MKLQAGFSRDFAKEWRLAQGRRKQKAKGKRQKAKMRRRNTSEMRCGLDGRLKVLPTFARLSLGNCVMHVGFRFPTRPICLRTTRVCLRITPICLRTAPGDYSCCAALLPFAFCLLPFDFSTSLRLFEQLQIAFDAGGQLRLLQTGGAFQRFA
ncbi:MAG: hypothetical protein JNM09_31625 [Blastocatellia bacterium]|nr:hypothetical protein [Blastocatellia bacterium]